MNDDIKKSADDEKRESGISPFKAQNIRGPIKLTGVNIQGVAAESSLGGESVEIITKISLLSTQSFFHRVAPSLANVIEHCAREAGKSISIARASSVLLVIHSDDTADLWIDSAAVEAQVRLKKSVQAMSAIFLDDIADVTEIWFPAVDVKEDDRVVYIFREGFRFGLVFDLRTGDPLDIPLMKREIARLDRQMRYADLYYMISTQELFAKMVAAGWFPFIEIMISEFNSLSSLIEGGLSLEDAEEKLFLKFDGPRIDRMFERWMTKSHFKSKEDILKAGTECYKNGQWIACLKIMITEIEGLLAEAYKMRTGETTRNKDKLLSFIVNLAVEYAGGEDSLFFPVGFGRYLSEYTFADSEKRIASRNAIGHGRAASSDYTQARALQCMLTIDQIAFYS